MYGNHVLQNKGVVMLKNLPKILTPELIKVLCEMGHGDEIVLVDANFPSCSVNKNVVRADGVSATELLKAILEVIPLDTYSDYNFLLMDTAAGDPVPSIWKDFEDIVKEMDKNAKIQKLERFEFYDRSKKAYAVVASGEERTYANVIIRKGVIK